MLPTLNGRTYSVEFLPNGLIRIDERGGCDWSGCFNADYSHAHGSLKLSKNQVEYLIQESRRMQAAWQAKFN